MIMALEAGVGGNRHLWRTYPPKDDRLSTCLLKIRSIARIPLPALLDHSALKFLTSVRSQNAGKTYGLQQKK